MKIAEAKVVITGATSGIGYETAKALKTLGADVVICGRGDDKVKDTSRQLGVYGFKADVRNEPEVKDLFNFAIRQMGGLNVLINNAGIGKSAFLTDT